MKATIFLSSIAVLAVLGALLVTPAGAEDEPPTPAAAPAPGPQAPNPEMMRAVHRAHAADADRDGAVSADEWSAFLEAARTGFAALDKDGDGALTREELPRTPPGMRPRSSGGPGMGGRGMGGPQGLRGPGMGGRRMGGPQGLRGPGMGGRGMGGPQGMRGPGMGGPMHGRPMGARPGPDGPPPHGGPPRQGPRAQHPQGGPAAGGRRPEDDLGAKIDRLTSVLEKFLERMESRPPR